MDEVLIYLLCNMTTKLTCPLGMMTKALLAKSLRAVGKLQEAELLKQTLRSEMLNVNLRQTCQHPVFGPELAFAFTLH